MNPDSSPFTPGQLVDAEFFTGRKKQVEELLTMVRMAKKRGLQVGWISGERGMGKSSLASFVGYLAERDKNAIVAHVHLGGVKDLDELARTTHLQLLKDNQNQSWAKVLWDKFGKGIKSVDAFGVKFELEKTADTLPTMAGSFPDALSHVVKTAGEDREVLFLTFDDINGLAENPKFPHWLKSMVDGEVTSRKPHINPVCLVFVGLEERLQQMVNENPSVIRIFRPLISVDPWTLEESDEFFKNSFEKHGVKVKQSEIESLTKYSGGLPAVAHELGDAVWENLDDQEVTSTDVFLGIVTAAERIGGRFLKRDVIQALQSKKYRSTLRKISQYIGLREFQFSKAQLRSLPLTADEKKNLDNFLNRMRKLGAIVPVKEGERGVYRFPTYLHRIYFLLEASEDAMRKRFRNN